MVSGGQECLRMYKLRRHARRSMVDESGNSSAQVCGISSLRYHALKVFGSILCHAWTELKTRLQTSSGIVDRIKQLLSSHEVRSLERQTQGSLQSRNGIFPIVLVRVVDLRRGNIRMSRARMPLSTYLPPGSREYMLVPLIPAPLNNFSRVGFVLLDTSIRQKTDIIMDVKVE